MRPWLLEVNHAPSFNIDTNLDYQVKSNLITDTFTILGVNTKDKMRLMQQTKIDPKKRFLDAQTGQESKQRITEKIEKIKRRHDAYEEDNLGGFIKAYPCDDP
jgi:tubulin polyglutamylase TTLL6/13